MQYAPKFQPVGALIPYARNSRTHSDAQIAQLAASIEEFGFAGIVVIRDGVIGKGHGTVAAATMLYNAGKRIYPPPGRSKGAEPFPDGTVPVLDATGWSDTQFRAYVIADNKLAENAGWDADLLALELGGLRDDEFDLSLLGFSEEDLSKYLDVLVGEGEGEVDDGVDPDEVLEPDYEQVVSKPGDLWLLGDHRLICGDCTDKAVVDRLLNGEKPHLMVTDPPYGVEYNARWRNERVDGGVRLDRAEGLVKNDEYADWCTAWMLFPGNVAYVWHAALRASEVQQSLEAARFKTRAQIIWAKNELVIGRGDYHWQHEPCWYAVRPPKSARWNGGRKQTTVWRMLDDLLRDGEDVYARRLDAETMYAVSGDESTVWEIPKPKKSETGHSTQKPVECMRRPMGNNSLRGDLVYEPFAGSGTTLIAGEMMGRKVRAVEIEPVYVDLAIRRWEKYSGRVAILEGSGGLVFDDVRAKRLGDE